MTDTMRVELRHQLAAGTTSLEDGIFQGAIFVAGPTKTEFPHLILAESAVESGAQVFPGALMFEDHGDRSTRNLVGRVLDASPGEVDGRPALLGRYFISESRQDLRTRIAEGILTDVSLSALTTGDMELSEEGREIFTITGFRDHRTENVYPPSVDLVTYAAAEGQISLSWVETDEDVSDDPERSAEEDFMPDQEQLAALQAQLEQAQEAAADLRAQHDALLAQVEREGLVRNLEAWLAAQMDEKPADLVARVEELCQPYFDIALEHGGDLDDLQAKVQVIIDREVEYFSRLNRSGMPSGLTSPDAGTDEPDYTAEIAALMGGD